MAAKTIRGMELGRKHYVDVAKGMAMLLVIVGHCHAYIPQSINTIIYSFHMPLFFALTGITFNPDKYRTVKELIVKRIRSLLLPYVVLCLLLLIYQIVFIDQFCYSVDWLKQLIGIAVSWRGTALYGSMWFIPALFCAEIPLYLLTRKYQDNYKALGIWAAALYAIGAVILCYVKGFIWSLDLLPINLSFLLCGYLYSHLSTQSHEFFKRNVTTIILLAVTIAAGSLNYHQNGWYEMYSGYIGNPVLFLISALCGTLASLSICQKINQCKALEFIGMNTMIYYAFQNRVAIPVMQKAISFAAVWMPFLANSIVAVILTVTGAVLLLALFSIILKKCLPFVFVNRKYAWNQKLPK